MEAVELGLREALMKDGRVLLEKLYNQPGLSVPGNASQPGEKCHPARAKDLQTLFGTIEVSRNYFYQVVFIGDGAAWIWELARVNFPAAIFILDLYHALERLHALCAGLYGEDSPWAIRMAHTWTAMLKNDQVGEVITAARRRRQDLGPPPQDALEKQIAYFAHHQDKMRYQTYRQQGLFYGSGVIEGGCKSVIGQRLKESGMFWTEAGATSVLNLRLALKSNRWDECWDRLHNSLYLKIKLAA